LFVFVAIGTGLTTASAGSADSLSQQPSIAVSSVVNATCAGDPATAYTASMAGNNASGTISRGSQAANFTIDTTKIVNHSSIEVSAVNSGDVGIEFRPQSWGAGFNIGSHPERYAGRWANPSADAAALTFDVANLVGSGPARVRLRQTLAGRTAGNSEASTYTVSWEGGGTAVVSDPVTTNDVYRCGAPTGCAAANGEIEGLATGDIIENGGSFVVYGTMNSKTQWHVDFPSGARNIKMNKVALSGATHAKGVITSPSDNPAMGRDVQLPRFGVSVNLDQALGANDGAPGYTYQEFFAFQIFFTPEGANCLPPVATDNVTTTPLNTPVTFNVLADDTSNSGVALDPSLVRLLDADNNAVTQLTVPGEGVFTVDAATGAITFTPVDGFTGTSSVTYVVTDSLGQKATAKFTVTVSRGPVATDNETTTPLNTPVTFNVLADDTSNSGVALDPSLVRLLDADNNAVTQVSVPGEGVFTVDAATGAITFTPVDGFTGISTVNYRVTDSLGQTATAKFTVTVPNSPSTVVTPSVNSGNTSSTTESTPKSAVTKPLEAGSLPAAGTQGMWLFLISVTLMVLGVALRATREGRVS
jgi:CshA-type fibril repeat protein